MATASRKKTAATRRKIAAAPAQKKETPQSAPAPKVNAHIEAGVDVTAYTGDSSFVNANRKARVLVKSGKAAGDLTERCQKSLYALRKAYGSKSFGAKGFDNGVLRDLNAAGLIALSGGQEQTSDGKTYMLDGATPLTVKITAAGQKYGVA